MVGLGYDHGRVGAGFKVGCGTVAQGVQVQAGALFDHGAGAVVPQPHPVGLRGRCLGDRSDLGEIIYLRGVGYAASSTGPLWWVKPGYHRLK
jgi:hypothetical protein